MTFLKSILIFTLLPFSIFALTGEFVSLEGQYDSKYNKIELMGSTAIISAGASSMTGTCKQQEGYISITITNKYGREFITSYQVAKNGTELIGKDGESEGLTYHKYSETTATPDKNLAFGDIIPPMPVSVENFKVTQFNIGYTANYDLFVDSIYKTYSANPDLMSPHMAQAAKMSQVYGSKHVAFTSYILDLFKNKAVGIGFRMYVNDKVVYQQLKIAKTAEERRKLISKYSEVFCQTHFLEFKSTFESIGGTSAYTLGLLYWTKHHDTYVYKKAQKACPSMDSILRKYESDSVVIKNIMPSINLLPMDFIVCNEKWEPVCWYDWGKSVNLEELLLADNAKNLKALVEELPLTIARVKANAEAAKTDSTAKAPADSSSTSTTPVDSSESN